MVRRTDTAIKPGTRRCSTRRHLHFFRQLSIWYSYPSFRTDFPPVSERSREAPVTFISESGWGCSNGYNFAVSMLPKTNQTREQETCLPACWIAASRVLAHYIHPHCPYPTLSWPTRPSVSSHLLRSHSHHYRDALQS